MANQLLTDSLMVPLDGATAAKFEIHVGDGNLILRSLGADEAVLARGELEYTERQGAPTQTVASSDGETTLKLRAGQAPQPWFRLPWAACNGAADWRIELNRSVPADITVRSNGGNLSLDLAGMSLTRVVANTGGGNIEVTLPQEASGLSTTAKTGAGSVTIAVGGGLRGSNRVTAQSGAGTVAVHLPSGLPTRVRASTGLGKVEVPAQFRQLDRHTYQSPDYEAASDRVEVTAGTGAGNVRIEVG
ncbi:MAG: hypothetical protein ACOYEW_02845 [Anaerolineae bacterium]|jgi:hypothetical protein